MYLEIFWRILRYFVFFWEFRGISRKHLNFAGSRPRELSEALSYRESNKGSKERQGPTLGVRFTEVFVL